MKKEDNTPSSENGVNSSKKDLGGGEEGQDIPVKGILALLGIVGFVLLLYFLPLASTPAPDASGGVGLFGLHWSIELSIWLGIGCVVGTVLVTVLKPEFVGGK